MTSSHLSIHLNAFFKKNRKIFFKAPPSLFKKTFLFHFLKHEKSVHIQEHHSKKIQNNSHLHLLTSENKDISSYDSLASTITESDFYCPSVEKKRQLKSEFKLEWLPPDRTSSFTDKSKNNALFILGAQKSGTTFLFENLKKHPELNASLKKELHFFSSDQYVSKGIEGFQENFSQKENVKYILEATPYYLFCPRSPSRIKFHFPQAKFIILLRSPEDRAISHYYHSMRHGFESHHILAALFFEFFRLRNERLRLIRNAFYPSHRHKGLSYLSRGFYSQQIDNWFYFFPRENFIILTFDELCNNPNETIQRITSWLNISPMSNEHISSTPQNEGNYSQENLILKKILRLIFKRERKVLFDRFQIKL